ncbi:protein mono-ADP-ribosyltransferase PARP14-like isoform X2 [Oculina patagonica]
MDSAQIWVSGFPDGTTKTELTIYFQSERDSGGGDVESIEIDGGRAIVTFEDVKAAARVFGRHNHRIKNCALEVALLPKQASSNPREEKNTSPEVDDSGPNDPQRRNNRSDPSDRFENQRFGQNNRWNSSEFCESPPASNGTDPGIDASESSPPVQCKVEVHGLPPGASEDLVTNYFENTKRSKGGPVSAVVMEPELQKCLVTFESPHDAIRTVEHSPHLLSGASLQVSLFEEFEDEHHDDLEENIDENDITIIVSGISPSTTEDAVINYFENSKRSGGGDVSNIEITDDGETMITFPEVKDLQRLLEHPHKIDGKPITVVRQRPKKKLPLDPVRIHVQGLCETTTEDCLRFYLEKFSDVEVEEVFFGSNNNALATFETEPDFESLFHKVNKDRKGLEGKKPRVDRVPICSCILVTGLKKETTDDTIELYFENEKRSGGKDVSQVERKGKDHALVHFEDPSSVQNVIAKSQAQSHILEGKTLDVKPHYAFLENTATKKIELAFDPEVFDYIQMNHEREFQTLLEEYKVLAELSRDSQNSIVTISPSGNVKKESDQSWKERAENFERFLHSFKKIEIAIASEIFDEIAQRWQKQSSNQGRSAFLVSFDDHRRLARLIGKGECVDQEEHKLLELIQEVTKDTELMKTVVQVVETNIPKSRLILLEMSGLCERLGDEHRHLSIAVDSEGQKLSLNGPRNLLQEVKIEVLTFTSKVVEQTTELPANVINVLKRPQVSKFMHDLLKQKSIQAMVLYDQGQSSNEIQVVGVDSRNTKEAENVLQGAIDEKSQRLTAENTQVLGSRKWKDFLSSLTSRLKVGVTVDSHANTIWVSGIANDVKECFDEVKTFLEINTIIHAVVPVEEGSAKFISTVWKQKLDGIKRELSNYSIDMRVTTDCEGIEVSGTAEGLEKCLPLLHDLIAAVKKDFVPVDKPGMKKFFLGDKGPSFLKTVEGKNKCTILTTERTESKSVAEAVAEEKEVWSAADVVCSYSTKEGRTISVMKGDITKDRVDAIVNAANDELKHIGGLAAAIVRAGGKQIQDECDTFITEKGRLLEGHTMVTTAGNLPCKQVIHAVGPKWDTSADKKKRTGEVTRQERYLKHAITSSLEEAKSLRSIAIPAVSSGVFGFPRDLCAKVILDAVLDFCKDNPHCTLSEIHLINNDDSTVKEFAEEFRRRFAKESNFTDQRSSRTARSVVGTASRANEAKIMRAQRSFTTQGIRITMKSGDLAREQADILVGTAASNLNLTQNPCAKALSQAAGPSLQQECTNIGHVAVGDIAVNNKPGNLRCKAVIFAICSEWDNGKGKKVLKRLLAKCLQEATNNGMASIAFPAIGTGTLQFPRSEVAEIYFDAVISFSQKNPANTLREVMFVLYDQDHLTVQAFEAEFQKRNEKNSPFPIRKNAPSMRSRYLTATTKEPQASSSQAATFSKVRERNQDHLETNVGTLCFKVQPGDITKETTDAIVIISNPDLDMKRGGGAGAAILKSGGDTIQRECFAKGVQLPGSVVITRAGKLKTRFIFHIVPSKPLNTQSIKAWVMKCLEEAEKNGISSISFPAIGTGNLGIPAKSCAETMLSAISDFNNQQPTSIQLIKMIVFQTEMIKDVRLALKEASGEVSTEKPGIFHRVVSKVGGLLGFGDSEKDVSSSMNRPNDSNKEIDLVIFAGCKEDLQGAIKEINEVIKEKSTKKVIEHEAIASFSKEHFRRIHTLEQRYEVLVSVETAVARIVVSGQSDDVVDVVGEIYKILHQLQEEEHERKRAEALSKNIQWMYKDGTNFVHYESHVNARIEIAYDDKKTAVTIISEEGDHFEIDFKSMTERDIYGIVTDVQRIDLRKGVPVPNHWTPQPKDSQGNEKTVHLYELDPSTDAQEYQKVQKQFQQTCGNQIVKIERVQNPALYGTYAVRKQKMDEGKGSNEQLLFHGTPGDNCALINHTGFNRSFHGKNATVYGNGVYFALDASYSARSTYSPADLLGFRYMYLTRVLVGEYTVGRRGLLTPPAKNQNDPTDTYDSVVDQNPNPAIFVVFYDWQCYPEYLITFQ